MQFDESWIPPQFSNFRRFPMDGALLLFDRDSGTNVLCEGEETSYLVQQAPRVVQFGITNACNLACTFCSRDIGASSKWTLDSAFDMLSQLSSQGVLEVAFGGGEPWAFKGFPELVTRLYNETDICVNFTTNGRLMPIQVLNELRGKFGQLRLSLYENNNWPERVRELSEQGHRFGVNYLVTPERLKELETTILRLCALGCKDILLLSYNGSDQRMHLTFEQSKELAQVTEILATSLMRSCRIKLDVCWGDRMESVPRLFSKGDCGAGREFIVLTSDKQLQPCSFFHTSIPVSDADEVMAIWRQRADELKQAAQVPGCARLPNFGLKSIGIERERTVV